jgi:hypothetical protein
MTSATHLRLEDTEPMDSVPSRNAFLDVLRSAAAPVRARGQDGQRFNILLA